MQEKNKSEFGFGCSAFDSVVGLSVTAPPRDFTQWINRDVHYPDITHVIFDFDGTLSWLRHGWPQMMLAVCLGYAEPNLQRDEMLRQKLLNEILSLNGKPSIFQIARVCSFLRPEEELPLVQTIVEEYSEMLRGVVRQRIEIAAGDPTEFLIFGAAAFLTALKNRGLTLIILSGTYQEDVEREAGLLGLRPFFDRHIYGSPVNGAFSKRDAIERLIKTEAISGGRLLAFGDGPVEIECTRAVGGLAIGVASDEQQNKSHLIDPVKQEHLIAAGAHAIIPDYVDGEQLIRQIWGT